MGVPKFYRWISERYPKINQIVSDNALLPEFDHLYLDMNGIIHGCTHPSHLDVSDVLSEKDMMLGIMHYLDRIITQIVKPKVSVYMAIDGVAPRAKLNQQRSRRFRSAKDLAEATKDLPKDEDGPNRGSASVFDSNCITPGTEFLAKVSEHIQYFIRKKLKEDPAWHGLTVIFSGHDIPGEGEHKIMQHIREMRSQPNYQPNTRHCIYGQDADLIMLGLVTHEPHFTILREVIDFSFDSGGKNTLKAVKKFTKESDFQLLHLSVLREYLQMEFAYQQPEYDLERIIDDFVFMTFLVGNDFLPHMPTLDIGDGAFDLLFRIYKKQRLTWGADPYLTLSGNVSDPQRLEVYLSAIGAAETEILIQREKNETDYIKKKRRWDKRDGNPEGPSDAELQASEARKQNDYLSMIEGMIAKHGTDSSAYVEGWTPVTKAGEKDFKGRYYFEKMKLAPIDKEDHWALRKSYMEGLIWCLAYYYRGCISWGWFYPYHYGPMLSDLINVPKMFAEIKFDIGEPLTPFQQLMGCLPPASSALVPKLYRWLMTSHESPIIQFYPENFEVDMNGKKNPWEGINLLPFIDIALLKSTIASHCPPNKLTEAERIRNSVGKVYCYRYDVSCTDNVISPGKNIGLPDINGSHSSISIIEENFISSNVTFGPKLVPGTQIPYPGFPSLDVLPIASVELAPIGLNCFGTASKYPNMLLTLHQMPELPPVEVLAENLIGKSVFVNWPMMHEGQVVALSDQTQEIRRVKDKVKKKDFSKAATDKWLSDTQIMSEMYHVGNGVPGSGGVQIGDVKIRLKLLPLQGMKTNPANGSTKKLFGKEEADVPLQLALWKAPAPDPRFEERGPMTLNDRFPEGSSVVLTKGKYRGCMGTVVGVADKKSVGVKVQTMPAEFPFGLAMARSHQDSFVSSVEAARILRIHPGVLGKIMGRLQFEQGRYDLGLNLKNNDGSCVVGYTRKKVEPKKSPSKKGKNNTDKSTAWEAGDSVLVVGSLRGNEDNDDKEERIQWEYTPKAIRLVQSYREKFPQLFAALKKIPNEKKYDANVVFGPNGEAWLPVVREWLDNHETAKLPRTPVSTDSMSYEAIAAVEHTASVRALALKKKGWPKESLIKIPGSALYREGSIGATDVLLASDLNDNQAPMLGDRIVNLCGDGIPFGAKGTVIAIHEAATTGSVEVVMDEEFLGGTSLQGACSNFRGKLCLWSQLLRIATDNSEELVDKLVPKGVTQEKAMNKIISTINRQMKNLPSHINSSWDGTVDSAEADVAAPQVSSCAPSVGLSTCAPSVGLSTLSAPPPAVVQGAVTKEKKRVESRTPPRSSSRAGSTGRARQAGWREARGPDEKGVGFKGTRKTKASGFVRWKNFVKTGSVPGRDAKVDVNLAAAELKKTLRVSAVPDTTSAAPASQTAELKAILGVKPAATPNSVQSSATASNPALTNASDDLKAVLGVGKGVGAAASSTPAAPPVIGPSSAADKLFALMAGKSGRENRSTYQQAPRSASSFSFTYVEEGKEPPAPAPVPPPVMPGPFPPGHLPMQPSPTPPPNVQFGFRPEGLPPMTEHPTLVCAKSTEKGPSVTDYPPLGGANPPAEVPKPIEEAKVERQSSNPTEFMVPASVIASKGNR